MKTYACHCGKRHRFDLGPRCVSCCTVLRNMGDSYYCPGCGDEWDFDLVNERWPQLCRHCGQAITYKEIAEDGFTHEPVMRWCVAERLPGLGTYMCPNNGGEDHEPEVQHNDGHEADNPLGVWCCQEHRAEHYAPMHNDGDAP